MLEAYLPRRRPGYWALGSEADGRGIPGKETERQAGPDADRNPTGGYWKTKYWRWIARQAAGYIGQQDGLQSGGIEEALQSTPGLRIDFQNECRPVVDAKVANLTVRTLKGVCSPLGQGVWG